MRLSDHMKTLSELTDDELILMLTELRKQKNQPAKTPERKIKSKKKKDKLLQQFRNLSPEERAKVIEQLEVK